MMSRSLALAALACVTLTGCPSDDHENPPRLWLTLDGSEVQVKLGPVQPPPF